MNAIELLTREIARLRDRARGDRQTARGYEESAARQRANAAEYEQSADEMQDAVNTIRARVSEPLRSEYGRTVR